MTDTEIREYILKHPEFKNAVDAAKEFVEYGREYLKIHALNILKVATIEPVSPYDLKKMLEKIHTEKAVNLYGKALESWSKLYSVLKDICQRKYGENAFETTVCIREGIKLALERAREELQIKEKLRSVLGELL